MSIAGHLAGVTEDRYGATLVTDLAVGDTVLEVDSTTDFDEASGGSVLINGTKLDYEAFDDPEDFDAESDGPTTLTLTAASTITADAGDRVWAHDPTTGSDDPVTEIVALVTLDDRDDGDAIPARIRAGLIDQLDSDFDIFVGKAVELDVTDQGELILVDILGSKPTPTSSVRGAEGPFTATAGTSHVLTLSHVPIDHTEHVTCWINQAETEWTRVGTELTLDDPDELIQAGDVITVKYLYLDVGQPPVVSTSVGGARSAAATVTVTSLVVPIDTPADGDTILLATCRASNAPAGWTVLASSGTFVVYAKVSDGTETSVTLTGTAAVMAGITVIVANASGINGAEGSQTQRLDQTYLAPAPGSGTAIVSFGLFDGPGPPPDEYITGSSPTALANLDVQSGLYGLAVAEGRATFSTTLGSGSSSFVGITIGGS